MRDRFTAALSWLVGLLFLPWALGPAHAAERPNVVLVMADDMGWGDNIDENMGKLDAFLRDCGLRENTILIFLTDNGGTVGVNVFNAGMRGRKIDLYDGGHRVPCFLRWPAGNLRSPGDVAELTQCQDILPTLVDLCGLQKPAGAKFDGLSLASLLRGQTERLPDRMLVVQSVSLKAGRTQLQTWFYAAEGKEICGAYYVYVQRK